MKNFIFCVVFCLLVTSCIPVSSTPGTASPASPGPTNVPVQGATQKPTAAQAPTATQTPAATLDAPGEQVPVFDHIVVISLENHSYQKVIGNPKAPYLNELADKNVLFTQYFAVAHPSLPNYLALTGGDTFGVTNDCTDCFVNQTSLPDLIEASGRTWKGYMEGMPSPCFLGSSGKYAQKHDPFIYFDAIRTQTDRCARSIVPLSQLDEDISTGQVPNFLFISPDQCNDGHDCNIEVPDQWLQPVMEKLQKDSVLGKSYAIFIVFDEGASDDTASCCGMGPNAGGHIAVILLSPQAKSGSQDNTELSHYSLLKTILASWGLPALGKSDQPGTELITEPWK